LAQVRAWPRGSARGARERALDQGVERRGDVTQAESVPVSQMPVMGIAAPGDKLALPMEPSLADCAATAPTRGYESKDIHLLLTRLRHEDLEPSKLTSRDIPIRVFAFQTVQFLKEQLVGQIPALRETKATDVMLVYKGMELKGKRGLDEYDLVGTAEHPCSVGYYVRQTKGGAEIGVEPDEMVPVAFGFRDRLAEVYQSLLSGIVPRLTDDGTGGTYKIFNRTKRHVIAMFKPRDEEAFAPNNPRQYVGAAESEGIRPGTYSTWGAAREVAAYLLDHENFARVPRTAHVHMKHPSFQNPTRADGSRNAVWKTGSLQEFVTAQDTAGNIASSQFAVQDVQRVGILDVRIVNMDRNDGNLLVKKRAERGDERALSKYVLIPIDHGLSLPDRLEVAEEDIVWMGWDQAKAPFGDAELKYIKNLSWEKDSRQLSRSLGIKKFPLRLMWVSYRLLQLGAAAGLNLFEIGQIMFRQDFEQPSTLQRLIEVSLDAASYSSNPAPTVSVAPRMKGGRGRESADTEKRRREHLTVESLDLYAGNARLSSARAAPSADGSTVPSVSPVGYPPTSEQSTPPPCMLPSPRSISDASLGANALVGATGTDEEDSEAAARRSCTEDDEEFMGGAGGTVVRLKPEEESGTVVRISTAVRTHIEVGGIFSRLDRSGRETLAWTAEMERIFRDHCEASLQRCVLAKKNDAKRAESTAD